MPKVLVNVSMSLDGFVTGPMVSAENALGVGGERLHDWLFHRNQRRGGETTANETANEVDVAVSREAHASTGAVILGRRIFDFGLQHWEDTPYPVPSFVLTHRPHAEMVMPSARFTFVTDGIESALRQAAAAAGERNVMLMGADVSQQFLKAGLVDEIVINLVPVLFGEGTRLFEHFGMERIELEIVRVLESREVTHLLYKILKSRP